MGNKLKLISAALALMLVVGCSSNPASLDRKALSENKISKIDLVSSDKMTYPKSSTASNASRAIPGGFLVGALGAGIDIAVNAKRAKAMEPIIGALGNYDMNAVFANKLKGIAGNSVANNVTVNVSQQPVASAVNTLNVTTIYTLAANHQSVTLNANTALQTKKDGSVYKRKFSAASNIDFATDGKTAINATEYLKKNPNKLKQAMESAMDNVVKQISNDINLGASQEAKLQSRHTHLAA